MSVFPHREVGPGSGPGIVDQELVEGEGTNHWGSSVFMQTLCKLNATRGKKKFSNEVN